MVVMVKTNMGEIPLEDYREIIAIQNGYESYEDMKKAGNVIINERIIYNAQKQILEEFKQELLKKAETARQSNVIKETCRNVSRRHKFEDIY